ncbi:hypothetical protein [Rhodococcus opacus]|uniref:hypothetical protein n=1 Tax=Rhodococcus opacus TaxID=37919 RepID=UPI0012FD5A12|nr:hypothetical protein [Rhodococcus opacus]
MAILIGLLVILMTSSVIFSVAFFEELPSITSIESELGALKQDRRILEGSLELTFLEAKVSHLEEAERDIDGLNKEGSRNRIYHNALQSIIIVGSLSATTLSGLSLGAIDAALPAAVFSLIVGISAGFAGYFKFRERSYTSTPLPTRSNTRSSSSSKASGGTGTASRRKHSKSLFRRRIACAKSRRSKHRISTARSTNIRAQTLDIEPGQVRWISLPRVNQPGMSGYQFM